MKTFSYVELLYKMLQMQLFHLLVLLKSEVFFWKLIYLALKMNSEDENRMSNLHF